MSTSRDPLAEDTNASILRAAKRALTMAGLVFGLAASVLSGAFWLSGVSATASSAKTQAEQNAEQLKGKADKDEVEKRLQRIEDKMDKMYDYLRKQ